MVIFCWNTTENLFLMKLSALDTIEFERAANATATELSCRWKAIWELGITIFRSLSGPFDTLVGDHHQCTFHCRIVLLETKYQTKGLWKQFVCLLLFVPRWRKGRILNLNDGAKAICASHCQVDQVESAPPTRAIRWSRLKMRHPPQSATCLGKMGEKPRIWLYV